jgi:hypothetical protein
VPRYSACILVQHGDEFTPKSPSEGPSIPVLVLDSTLVTVRSGSYPKLDQVEEQVIGTVTVTIRLAGLFGCSPLGVWRVFGPMVQYNWRVSCKFHEFHEWNVHNTPKHTTTGERYMMICI